MPLEGDEAYYWVWSRHLAAGYIDHPPMVAWLIAALSFLGKSALAIRLPFILAEGAAALLVGFVVIALGAGAAGASAATMIFALIPQHRMLIGEAQPDAPYVLFWSLALYFAARAAQSESMRDRFALGVAAGGILLSRLFGWAVVAGIACYSLTDAGARIRRHAWIALAVAAALYAPYLVWNATHAWAGFTFAFLQRERWIPHWNQAPFIRFTALTIALIVLTAATTRKPRLALLAWTALPMLIGLGLFALAKDVETWWLMGPFVSLCAALGIAVVQLPRGSRIALTILWSCAAAWTAAVVALAALALPSPLYVRDFAFRGLAKDVRAISARTRAVPMSNRYEIASQLRYAGIPALMFGREPQVASWQHWYGDGKPRRAIVIALYPPRDEPQLQAALHRFCTKTAPGPTLAYVTNRTSSETFYTQWCDNEPSHRTNDRTGQPNPQ